MEHWDHRLKLFLFAIVGALSTGGLFHIVGSREPVGALWLVLTSVGLYWLAYRTYGVFLATQVAGLSDDTPTPACLYPNDPKFRPTSKWVLFGHHFAAIAGAGPLIGPVLAAQYGYVPGFLWILFGAILAGGVHDFVILVASSRRKAMSLVGLASSVLGEWGGKLTGIAVLAILILALAGLGLAVTNTLKHNVWATWVLLTTIPIALVMGYGLIRVPARTGTISLMGSAALLTSLLCGPWIVAHTGGALDFTRNEIVFGLAAYTFIAALLPPWILLVPRDFLSSFLKIGTVVLLGLAVIAIHPALHAPPVSSFLGGGGPVVPGAVFPFVFITIACGALSGFHSLVSSGTTSRLLSRESESFLIGYGSMLTEGFVAVIALIAAAALYPGDYLAINTHLSPQTLAGMNWPVHSLDDLSRMVGATLQGRPGGAISLAAGMSFILSRWSILIPYLGDLFQFILLFEGIFILTTLDAGTRVARNILEESAVSLFPALSGKWMTGALFTALVVAGWSGFITSGTVASIWPLFGLSNQILGMIALAVGTLLLMNRAKWWYALTTGIPMVFMIAVTASAGIELVQSFWSRHMRLDTTIGVVLLLVSAVLVLLTFFRILRNPSFERPGLLAMVNPSAEGES